MFFQKINLDYYSKFTLVTTFQGSRIDFISLKCALKVVKPHISSKEHGSSPRFMSQTDLHCSKPCKHASKEVCDVKRGLDPCPLLARSWNRWWLDFTTFIAYKKVKIKFKKARCFLNKCNDLFKWKKYFGFRCTLNSSKSLA